MINDIYLQYGNHFKCHGGPSLHRQLLEQTYI